MTGERKVAAVRGELSDQDIIDMLSIGTLYQSMLWTASQYATTPDLSRLECVREMEDTRKRVGYLTGSICTRRLFHAAHLLTGPVALRLHGAVSGGHQNGAGGLDLDLLLNWKRFGSSLSERSRYVEMLMVSPLDPLLRSSMTLLLDLLDAGDRRVAAAHVISIMSQVARFDAAGASEIVDVAVACLLPPA